MQLRSYQNEAIDSIYRYFYGAQGNPLVVMPTGTGKSVVIGGFAYSVLSQFPFQRMLCLTHVKELVEQNAKKMQEIWPLAPLGIYSAGLGRKDMAQPIIFGGVASVVNVIEDLGHIDLLLIDEAHLVGDAEASMYQVIIAALKKRNPYLKVIGFTATDFRMGMGRLTEGSVFTDVCFDISGIEAFARLIAEGYLAPLVPKRTRTEVDTSNVGMVKGDYAKGELQTATMKVTRAAITEAMETASQRRSWLVFCAGNENAELTAEILNEFGIRSTFIHSKIKSGERDERINDFKSGYYQAICNNNILTTGFDHPPIDLIIMLRATMSPGLWVQMLGRGTRPYYGKTDCLVLDFAGNCRRLGPINDPVIPKKKGPGAGDAPVRICEACDCYNHAAARVCAFCGEEFTFKLKIRDTSGTDELIRSDLPIVEWFNVSYVRYGGHNSKAGNTSVKVVYECGLHRFNEFVSFGGSQWAAKRARDWWRLRAPGEPPETVDEALLRLDALVPPRRVKVWVNKPHPEVLQSEF